MSLPENVVCFACAKHCILYIQHKRNFFLPPKEYFALSLDWMNDGQTLATDCVSVSVYILHAIGYPHRRWSLVPLHTFLFRINKRMNRKKRRKYLFDTHNCLIMHHVPHRLHCSSYHFRSFTYMRNTQIQSTWNKNYMTNAPESMTIQAYIVCGTERTHISQRKLSNPLKCSINECEWFIATDDRFLTTINTYHLFVKWGSDSIKVSHLLRMLTFDWPVISNYIEFLAIVQNTSFCCCARLNIVHI